MKKSIFPLYILLLLTGSCKEKMEHNPVFTDSGNPEPIQNMEYRAINGGFEVSYDLPADKDILYVKAEYIDANGALAETRSSAYDSQVTIEGFGEPDERSEERRGGKGGGNT